MADDAASSSAPEHDRRSFDCPSCGAYTGQTWYRLTANPKYPVPNAGITNYGAPFDATICDKCQEWSLWQAHTKAMVYPPARIGPVANTDMPDAATKLYEEAQSVAQLSPRAAAGLLRVSLETMLRALYPTENDLSGCIAAAVRDGLRQAVQQAMDILRITGNDALHLSEIRLEDDPSTVTALFGLINLVAEQLISEPKALAAMYADLPESKRQAIDRRDGSASSS